ncbi:methylmalonic aciduria and homocystinuria type D protein [Phormidesmis priestleyi ULC007]|uniref:Methylmalonic aciduria and homocystinuria type D protein n=1 Tax=Phormidesmis priestleyi ULC007 TaxID=1920490 RepID=A0A2T1D4Q9_9CYAN|nr:methylmalonic aciduria and homocystinuria type D protein [Phormidesmis priestleyi ULC007]PZO46386.1 MAG: methylmalonic aciduria and homocystinuria type D protein [Phormidesmis priestleyi]
MEYSIHAPNPFICKNLPRLLPDWSQPVRSVLVVLQPSQLELMQVTPETDAQKQQLRQRFLEFGLKIVCKLRQLGYLADLFDPRTGQPLLSQAGTLRLDDVAVVRSTLGYSTTQFGNCCSILHPHWGSAVYPSILISSAESSQVKSAIVEVEGLLETHHSLSGCGSLTE